MPLNEQNNGIVTLDSNLDRLPILEAWVNSSSVYWIRTAFPVSELYFKVGDGNAEKFIATLRAYYHPERRMFRVYVPGRYFTEHCETAYKIVAKDEYQARTVLGEGMLRVYKGKITEMNETNRPCFAHFPDDKWRKVEVAEDETGAPAYTISKETYDITGVTTELYAYDKSKGVFFRVYGSFDSTGTPTLDVEQTPSTDGFECFVKDVQVGFYRRMDSFEDSTRTESLETGAVIV